MKTLLIKTESSLWVNFKRTMYAFMVIAVALAIPLLGYLELSHNDNVDDQKENIEKVENITGSALKANMVKL